MKVIDVAQQTFALLPAHWPVANARLFLRGIEATHIVVARADGPGYHYLYSREQFEAQLDRATAKMLLFEALNLSENTRTETVDGETDLATAPGRAVVTHDSHVVGFIDVTPLAPPTRGTRGGARRSTTRSRTFSAYPRVDAPDQVEPEQPFDIEVGFRNDPDPRLAGAPRITLERVTGHDQCQVVITAEGATLDRNLDTLDLTLAAAQTFHATPLPGVSRARFKIQLFFKQQLIASVERTVIVGQAGAVAETLSPPTNPCRVGIPSDDQAVDLTVMIHFEPTTGTLAWRFSAPDPVIDPSTPPVMTTIANAPQFAASLINNLRADSFSGAFAGNTLESMGQVIAGAMPSELFAHLKRVHAAVGRLPTLLLITDELYVPWELAYLFEPLDPSAPPFLAAQTQMGRWLEDESAVLPPPIELEVERITVVAGGYTLASGFRDLKEAVKEKETLQTRWQAIPLEATRQDLASVATGQRLPGHLIHFAVHGMSDATVNDQALLLADRSQLRAHALTGAYRCGEVPRFSFVFLNACQVGTPGESLGQAGGFPGVLISRGASGFVAPLWEVDDTLAREIAERFYDATLSNEATPVAAMLQRVRSFYQSDGPTTPLAYVYYGHPKLRLHFASD